MQAARSYPNCAPVWLDSTRSCIVANVAVISKLLVRGHEYCFVSPGINQGLDMMQAAVLLHCIVQLHAGTAPSSVLPADQETISKTLHVCLQPSMASAPRTWSTAANQRRCSYNVAPLFPSPPPPPQGSLPVGVHISFMACL